MLSFKFTIAQDFPRVAFADICSVSAFGKSYYERS
jgi:hypothetical protein